MTTLRYSIHEMAK